MTGLFRDRPLVAGHICGLEHLTLSRSLEGNKMLITRHRTFGYLALAGMLAVFAAEGCAGDRDRKPLPDFVLKASPGPSAIKLEVSMDKPGERVAIHVRTESDAWLTVIEIQTVKDGQFVKFRLPMVEGSPGFLRGGKSYALFADFFFALQNRQMVTGRKLMFVVTAQPFGPEPLNYFTQEGWITISPSPGGPFKILQNKLEQLAKDPGFNRVVIDFPSMEGKFQPLQASPADKVSTLKPKTLPLLQGGGAETVSGVQGRKQ